MRNKMKKAIIMALMAAASVSASAPSKLNIEAIMVEQLKLFEIQ